MKKIFILISCLILGLFGLWQIKLIVFAEQSGGSPPTSATSRIKTINDFLITLGVGSTASGTWGDWGAMWNRIYSVSNIDYSKQSLVEWDDSKTGDEIGEESSWTNTANVGVGSTANVWKDTRTGLYWSANLGIGNSGNSFPDTTHTGCPFFTNRITYDGLTSACGQAINNCGALSLEAVTGSGAKTDWYLPSQKELMQAYIDGMYNQAGSSFTTTSFFWSSTEKSDDPTNAWRVPLNLGLMVNSAKTTATYSVRCVRRD